jgi:hypothetical protein
MIGRIVPPVDASPAAVAVSAAMRGSRALPAGLAAVPGVALVLLAACGPKAPPVSTASVGPLVRGSQVTVEEFTVADDAILSYRGPRDALGLILAEQVARELRERGHDARAIAARAVAPASAPVRVVGRITMLDGGSRGLRYWVGFGAGAAKLGVAGDVIGAGGARVGTFSDERWSAVGRFGGASQDLLEKCARTLGADIAEMIDTGEYRRVGRPAPDGTPDAR